MSCYITRCTVAGYVQDHEDIYLMRAPLPSHSTTVGSRTKHQAVIIWPHLTSFLPHGNASSHIGQSLASLVLDFVLDPYFIIVIKVLCLTLS